MHLFEFTVTIYLFNSNYRRKSGPSEVTGGNLKSSFINIENQIQYNSLGIRYPYTLTIHTQNSVSRRREKDEYRIRLSLNVCVCCKCPHKCLVSVDFFFCIEQSVSQFPLLHTLPVQHVFSGNMQGFLCSFSPFAHQNLKLVKRNLKVLNGFDGPTINPNVSSKAFLRMREIHPLSIHVHFIVIIGQIINYS